MHRHKEYFLYLARGVTQIVANTHNGGQLKVLTQLLFSTLNENFELPSIVLQSPEIAGRMGIMDRKVSEKRAVYVHYP
jgi:hypothetical protein